MKEPPLADTSDDSIGVKMCAVLTFEQDERSQRCFCCFFHVQHAGVTYSGRLCMSHEIVFDSLHFFLIPTDLNVMVQRAPTVKAQQARQWVEPLSGLLFLF